MILYFICVVLLALFVHKDFLYMIRNFDSTNKREKVIAKICYWTYCSAVIVLIAIGIGKIVFKF